MNKLFLILTFLISGFNYSSAQSTNEDALRKRIIKGIADYRSELVNNTYANLEEYIKTSFANSGNDFEKTLKTVKSLSVKGIRKKHPNKNLYSEIRKYELGKKSIFKDYSPIEMKIVGENIDLFGLAFQQILKPEFPYGINPKTKFIDEVIFAGIDDGDRVADIGAGSGEIPFLWAVIFKDLELFLTDIGKIQIEVMNFKSKNIGCLDSSNVFHILKGDKINTGVEGQNLDKIVLRLSFHHFKKKKAMLESIKKSLAPDGELILIEWEPYFLEGYEHKLSCNKAMYQADIEPILEKNGFKLIDSKRDERTIYLKYKIAN